MTNTPKFYLLRLSTNEYMPVEAEMHFGRNTFPEDGKMSREHCRIKLIEDKVQLVDLGSKNKTWLNNEDMDPFEKIFLQVNDVFRIGQESFKLVLQTNLPQNSNKSKIDTTVAGPSDAEAEAQEAAKGLKTPTPEAKNSEQNEGTFVFQVEAIDEAQPKSNRMAAAAPKSDKAPGKIELEAPNRKGQNNDGTSNSAQNSVSSSGSRPRTEHTYDSLASMKKKYDEKKNRSLKLMTSIEPLLLLNFKKNRLGKMQPRDERTRTRKEDMDIELQQITYRTQKLLLLLAVLGGGIYLLFHPEKLAEYGIHF